jgi:CBS domain-containing protein
MGSSQSLKQQFTDRLLNDLEALDRMLSEDFFEKGKMRIGAEQEFCMIDYGLRPAMIATSMLEELNDEYFTNELARFNLELNLKPLEFTGDCFAVLENELITKLTEANRIAHSLGAKIILTGILPTISKADIKIENISPKERYKKLNEAILAARSSDFKFHISGIDELIDKHDNILFESCNTSFQVHFQVEASKAISLYNWARAISGPVLAAATNSPLFLGRRLWKETRIALFQQSADTRKSVSPYREEKERVTYGKDWVRGSALQIFRDKVRQYAILLPMDIREDSLQTYESGGCPKLKALCLHNSTIYDWNRLCYGVTDGRPHLRIENRYLPSGPTIIDEVANTAFWVGLMNGYGDTYRPIHEKMDFSDARNNFFSAAKSGLHAQFVWLNKEVMPAQNLLLDELLPMARDGLAAGGIARHDIDKYLGIIERRVAQADTGAEWILSSYNRLTENASSEEARATITEGIYRRQKANTPVHEWSELHREEGGGWRNRYRYVKNLMSNDPITLYQDDLLILAKNIMIWSNFHHIPVEDEAGRLLGLLTSDQILEQVGTKSVQEFRNLTVGDLMSRNPLHVSPETRIREAYTLMKNNEVECLPVVVDTKLVGIVTRNDLLDLVGFFFEEVSEQKD